MKNKFLALALMILGLAFLLTSCEDTPPIDYQPKNFVEGYLIVDQPIENITVMRTQPINEPYNYENSLIRDAEVTIIGDNQVFNLSIAPKGDSGYYNPDRSYLIKPETKYELHIKLKDGTIITGETTTPSRFSWKEKIKPQVQYPLDSVKLPPTDYISWEPVQKTGDLTGFYIIRVIPLDTLNYGKYLDPPTEELNRHPFSPFKEEDNYKEFSAAGFVANTRTSVVWSVFNWFGKQKVQVYAGDDNFINWFLQNQQARAINDQLRSVHGGEGCFASASMIQDTFFLLKNQP